jgi:hypothetical protein
LKNRKAQLRNGPRFAYDGLNRVIHERARLSLLTSLMTHSKGLTFAELKDFCALTDGNLNRHLLVLEDARLVTVSKNQSGGRTQTRCRISSTGRKRYLEYLAVLEQVIVDGAAGAKQDLRPSVSRGSAPA